MVQAAMEKTKNMLERFAEVDKILERNGKNKAKLIRILQEVQEEYKYLPEDIMAYVANSLGLAPAKVFGVATFYAHFALSPKGKHVFRVCDGTACHVKGSQKIIDALRSELKLEDGQTTSDDMVFTVETVSCLGACGLAPVLVIDEDVHGQVTADKAMELVRALREQEKA